MSSSVRTRVFAVVATALLASGCAVPVLVDEPSADVDAVASALAADGVSSVREERSGGMVSLFVRSDDAVRAFRVARRMERAPAASWIPTEREAHAATEHARARELEHLVRSVPGVVSATVALRLPLRDPLRGERGEPARASVVMQASNDVTAERVQRVVASAVDGLSARDVSVEIAPARTPVSPPALSIVGPFVVAAPSAGPLRATLAVLLGSMAIASSLFAWSRLRRRA